MPAMPFAASAALVAAITSPVSLPTPAWAQDPRDSAPLRGETHHVTLVEGRQIAWREAGDRSKPTILLLRDDARDLKETRTMMRTLAGRFHIVVPDEALPQGATGADAAALIEPLAHVLDIETYTVRTTLAHWPH